MFYDAWVVNLPLLRFEPEVYVLQVNYRPMSLNCIPCKIMACMEAVMKDKIQEHVDNHWALSEKQHGFSQKKSCLTNLLETLEEITYNLDRGNGVDIVFLDYQKAFDSVPHAQEIVEQAKFVWRWREDP